MTLFATLDSHHAREASTASSRTATPRTRRRTDAIWEALHVVACSRALRRVRHRPQPPRLVAARVRAACARAARHDRARLLRSGDPAGVPPARELGARLDLVRRPRARASSTRRTSTTASTRQSCRSIRRAATLSSSSVASTPTREPPTAIEIAARAGRRLVICGIVQDDGVLPRVRRAARSTATASPTSARSARPSVPRFSAPRWRCSTRSPSPSRSASRSSRR